MGYFYPSSTVVGYTLYCHVTLALLSMLLLHFMLLDNTCILYGHIAS